MRGSHLRKFLKTLDLLSRPQGATIEELAEDLEVDRSSVYRELAFIEGLGFPVYDEKDESSAGGRRLRKKLDADYLKKLPNMNIPDVELSPSEVVALYLLKGEERLYRGTGIEQALASAFVKIGLMASDDLPGKLDKVRTLLLPSSKGGKDYSGLEKIIDDLAGAILQNRTCRATYHSFYDDKIKVFDIDPLHFFEHNGGLYLFVRITGSADIRTLAVERFRKLAVTEATFDYPSDFDAAERLGAAFGVVYDDPLEVSIRFSARQARYIKERRWAAEQRIIDQPDGSIILEMKTSGRWEVRRWVLSCGADAEVLEPADFRDEVGRALVSAARRYT